MTMKRILLIVAVGIMTAMNAIAQRVVVTDTNGQGIPLVSVLTDEGNLIGTTDLNGIIADVKGAAKIALTHVAYKPQLVTVATLPTVGDGGHRVTMEDLDYGLDEIVVKPKPYIYVEAYYRVYVYRNDSLCYFFTGIMPNAYDAQKKKKQHGSYYQACAEYSNQFLSAWSSRAHNYNAGQVITTSLKEAEKLLKEKYFISATIDSPTHTTYSNAKGTVGQLVRTDGQVRMTLDAGTAQMYANEVKGETKQLERRQERGYEYQYTRIYADDVDGNPDISNFIMYSNQWEYNDKKSHVKFIIETYATDHYYMDKQEWKNHKKAIKEEYGTTMTLEELADYERRHNIPALSPVTLQAISKMKKQW